MNEQHAWSNVVAARQRTGQQLRICCVDSVIWCTRVAAVRVALCCAVCAVRVVHGQQHINNMQLRMCSGCAVRAAIAALPAWMYMMPPDNLLLDDMHVYMGHVCTHIHL